jgi:gamma-glutamylaminecyclotransferase
MSKVFVYGTLKKGYCNHSCLEDSPLVGKGKSVPRFRMFTNGYFPMVIRTFNTEGVQVTGEVYEVSPETLARLDRLEGVSYGHYRRDACAVRFEDGYQVTAYVYVFCQNVFSLTPVLSGEWTE